MFCWGPPTPSTPLNARVRPTLTRDGAGGVGRCRRRRRRHQVVQQVLGVRGLSAAAAAEQHDALVLALGEQRSVRRLRRAVDVRRHVVRLTAAEHLNHL